MLAWLISGGIAGLLKPFLALGDKWLSNQADKERLKAGTDRVVYEADAAVRKVKLGYLLLRLPLFYEMSENEIARVCIAIGEFFAG